MRLALFLALLLPLCAQPPQQGQKKGPPPAPKNLQVLTPEEERPMMGGMRGSLGVMCTHCHVQDRASDELPKKLVARSMMSMVKEINARFQDGKTHVTCYTCHRGQLVPETVVPPVAPAP
jgi:photosynthetic reaction center cytochrome c subunit